MQLLGGGRGGEPGAPAHLRRGVGTSRSEGSVGAVAAGVTATPTREEEEVPGQSLRGDGSSLCG